MQQETNGLLSGIGSELRQLNTSFMGVARVNDFWVRIYICCLAEAVGKAIPDEYNMRQFNQKSVADRTAIFKEVMSTAAATFREN